MGILVSKADQHHKEFKFTVTVKGDDVGFQFNGGEGISAEKIGLLMHGIMDGHFNAEILDAMEKWGEDHDFLKVMRIINAWTSQREDDIDGPKRYSVHPRDVFNLLYAQHGPPTNG